MSYKQLSLCFDALTTTKQAVRQGVKYPKYLLLTPGWYESGWWKPVEGEDTAGCSQTRREEVLENTLAIWQFDFISNNSLFADSGIVSVYAHSSICLVTYCKYNIVEDYLL